MLNKLKVTTNVNPEAKAFFKIILFSIIIFICVLVPVSIFYFFYNPPQSKIGGFLLSLSYGLFVGYVFGLWWPSKFKSYFNKLADKTNELDTQLENDSLYEIIKIDSSKFPPELIQLLAKWKSETDIKEKNRTFRKLLSLLELCYENQDAKNLSLPTKATYEKIIGTLLDITLSKGAIASQEAIKEEIIDLYDINPEDKKGLSERNIAGILSDSNLIHEAALIKRAHHIKMKTKIAN